jgi:ABC-2 type transport system ATP-binding protein
VGGWSARFLRVTERAVLGHLFPYPAGTMPTAPTITTTPSSGRATEPAVVATGVSRSYGETRAVRDLHLEVPTGSIVGLIGPSGSGKTTTVRMLTGIERPDEGEVRVLGAPPMTFSAAERARLGYMPQLPVLFPNLSLWENLRFVASIYGMPPRRRKPLHKVLELVELDGERRKRLRDASGGMQRRLALAAALVHDPELLFLDEPTAGIDPVLRRRFWEHFKGLRERGVTLLVTTQYVGEAAYCDYVAVLAHGHVVAMDTPEGLRRLAYGGEVLDVRTADPLTEEDVQDLRALPYVLAMRRIDDFGRRWRVVVEEADRAIPRLHQWLREAGQHVDSLQHDVPAFDDVFVALVAVDPT